MVIGIDIGSTTTKTVAIYPDSTIKKLTTTACDAVTSATGALGKIMFEAGVQITDIKHIALTGVGASSINGNLFGIPTSKIEEITAIGLGGMYLSGKKNVLIANIGTGTALVEAKENSTRHIGGTGVGGGTITGLAKAILKITDIGLIIQMAEKGHIENIDLKIGDVFNSNLSFLEREMTAANFGKLKDTATPEDIARGILNMVYEVIGMVSVFAAKSRNLDTVIVTGNASNIAIGQEILNIISGMYAVDFNYPNDAEYTTAIGAALSQTGFK
ncbi:pantothenate kinase [Brucepastera parasyntrophica]|uniref:BadF/BadG/BcrA/BcrD ATPase family protein n=1 Tax=Brucepastera parasyntrophica TaxID=2880008 RepID=UPI00210B6710|nr:BadF/BadG/BcrA/BcrD ATPase family protein [Brucepastera parasyntrophica]ULQ58594.1 pantothenate kinase [Brucepastera parasyntrophica]